MKYLILTLSLASMTALAQSPKPQIKELSIEALNKKMISVVKDAEIDKQLGEVEIFEECKKKNKFEPSLQSTDPQVTLNLELAVKCFREKLGKEQDEKKLLEMATKLNLQGYGLIQSKNIKDITKYLGNKMYKAMTGVDKEAADLKTTIANMRFNAPNKKMIDQRDFIDLYQTQLGKNALLEISRFCFEDFRIDGSTTSTFAEHWKDFFSGTKDAIGYSVATLTDLGSQPPAASFLPTGTTQDNIGDQIYDGIGKNLVTSKLSDFFTFCGKNIRLLCDYSKTNNEDVKDAAASATVTQNKATAKLTKGSKACITQARLEGYRKAIAESAKIALDFDKMSSQDMALQLDEGATVQFYDQGKSNQKNSIDNLTNFSSKDILDGGLDKNVDYDELKAKCAANSDDKECEDFLAVDDSLKKAEHNLDMDILLKKEIQLARVKKAVEKSKESVAEYLEQEGYLDLLERYNNDPVTVGAQLEKEISLIFEAKRLAALQGLKKNLGSRQMTETEAKNDKTLKSTNIQTNINQSQEERGRLAQVVLFNNIITSNLELYSGPKGKEKYLGQNTNAWKVEEDSRGGKTNPDLFKNLKKDAESKKSVDTSGTSVVGLGMLDTILGKPKK